MKYSRMPSVARIDQDEGVHSQLLNDLYTPLALLKGAVLLVRRHWSSLDEGRRDQILEMALDAADELASVIREARLGDERVPRNSAKVELD